MLTDALSRAGLQPTDLSHVNAHGLSTIDDDRYEAQAIQAVLGDVPVTAPKSFFGHLGAGCGAVELVGSLSALQAGEIPITLNYEHPDPECPIDVVCHEPRRLLPTTAQRRRETQHVASWPCRGFGDRRPSDYDLQSN